MMSLPARPDVVVIGAGAAGIAAGRALAARRVSFVILEGRERVGGRAFTTQIAGGHLIDRGCEWLHSADRNALADLAEEQGYALDKSQPPWRKRQEQPGFDEAAQDDFAVASNAFFDRLEEAGLAGREGPAAVLLEPGNRWNGLLEAISTYYNGAPLERVSVIDFHRYLDTEVNWRVAGGFGSLITSLAASLPVRMGCRATRIRSEGRDIRIETDRGTIATEKVVVTVPSSVLAAGAIRFEAALADHLDAAAGLPLGVANKVFFALADAEAFEPDTRLLGRIDHVDAGSYTLRVRGGPLVEGYFGGDHARALEASGPAAFADAARREITAALGRDIGARLTPLAVTGWAQDPFSLGSYSHALPGCADARKSLAIPFEDRIVFAGEATSPHFFSTAHGAWEEGTRAVARLFDGAAAIGEAGALQEPA